MLFEGLWGDADPAEALRGRLRRVVHKALRRAPGHHAPYPGDVLAALPLAGVTTPARVCEVVAASAWGTPRLERLADVEWVRTLAMPLAERPLGVTPQYAVSAQAT